jgi:hypothetical protein
MPVIEWVTGWLTADLRFAPTPLIDADTARKPLWGDIRF